MTNTMNQDNGQWRKGRGEHELSEKCFRGRIEPLGVVDGNQHWMFTELIGAAHGQLVRGGVSE